MKKVRRHTYPSTRINEDEREAEQIG